MPDAFDSVLPPDQPTSSWLSRNRRIVILGSIALVLLVAAVLTAIIPRLMSKQGTSDTVNVVNATTDNGRTNTSGSVTNESTRTTFQRSTVSNVNTSPPPTYVTPGTAQLQQAIQQLQAAKPTNQ